MVGSSRPRSPGLMYAVLSVLLMVLIGLVAFTARTPPPPTIAEFAPQSVDNITEAPDDQSSGSGRIGGLGPAGAPEPTPTSAPQQVIDVPRVRKCVGDPPRQIEDPQSPPCVPYWSGDNGGSTYKGVSRDAIVVAAPDCDQSMCDGLAAFFNKRFEFYGRKLRVVKLDQGGAPQTDAASPDKLRAAAVFVDEQMRAFASIDQSKGSGYHYYDELAIRGLISVSNEVNSTEADLESHRPYWWQYPMDADALFSNIGEWTCRRFAGRNARYAGDPPLRVSRRIFGIILTKTYVEVPVTTDPVVRQLAGCGERPAESVTFSGTDPQNAQNATNAVVKMKTAGVSSVICLCHAVQAGHMYRAAFGQQYTPEWLVSTYLVMDNNFILRTFGDAPTELASTLGMTVRPRQVPVEQNPSWWALREADTSQQGAGKPSVSLSTLNVAYRPLLLLASGIQLAGPHLTPQTFERGLQAARFPNPPSEIQAGAVGFAGDHAMTDDGAEYWWSNTAPSPYPDEGAGTICYVDGGARRRRGQWPSGDEGFVTPQCDSGAGGS